MRRSGREPPTTSSFGTPAARAPQIDKSAVADLRRDEGAVAGLILVGRFGAPQGVRGEIRVQSFTADPLALQDYAPLTDASGARTFAIAALRPLRQTMLVATVDGVADRDAATALTGTDIFARREKLPPPGDDEFYVADLVGLDAVDPDDVAIGRIVAVPNFGAGDIVEIAPNAGGETLLVPFTRAFVPTLDFARRQVTVVLPTDEQDSATPA